MFLVHINHNFPFRRCQICKYNSGTFSPVGQFSTLKREYQCRNEKSISSQKSILWIPENHLSFQPVPGESGVRRCEFRRPSYAVLFCSWSSRKGEWLFKNLSNWQFQKKVLSDSFTELCPSFQCTGVSLKSFTCRRITKFDKCTLTLSRWIMCVVFGDIMSDLKWLYFHHGICYREASVTNLCR